MNLYLGSNEIFEIASGAFNKMTMLRTLDLSNNFIFELSPEAFEQIPITTLLLNGNNLAHFPIPGWNTETNEINQDNHTLSDLQILNIENNPFQCSCLELIHAWAQSRQFMALIYDEKARLGLKPACIVNEEACKIDVGRDFVKDYWHLFNDHKIRDVLMLDN
ncbi:hypothetical protein DMENIID0001_041170 [Sergentomyia squamirostris]